MAWWYVESDGCGPYIVEDGVGRIATIDCESFRSNGSNTDWRRAWMMALAHRMFDVCSALVRHGPEQSTIGQCRHVVELVEKHAMLKRPRTKVECPDEASYDEAISVAASVGASDDVLRMVAVLFRKPIDRVRDDVGEFNGERSSS